MSDVSFRQSFINYTKDGVLDKSEIDALKKKAEEVKTADPGSADAQIAEGVIKDLDKYDSSTKMTYTLSSQDSSPPVTLKFELTPTYSEKDKVKGKTMEEAISNISQGDSIAATKSDSDRCGAATMLNIAMRTLAAQNPGKSPAEIFAMVAEKVGVPKDFTYENVHKAQDKLYTAANTDKKAGITAGYSYKYDASGKITSATATGEVKALADKLGLKLQPLLGPTKDNLDDKKAAVDKFFANNPNGSIMVGVNLDTNTGKISPLSSADDQNHFVEIYKKDGKYYMKDTGATTNGKGEKDKEIDINTFVYNNPGTTMGVTR